jgi:oxaloacetate decarboxylase alpha subunit
MERVTFVDTTFRDGHASLWAEAMTTGMMLPVAPAMDAAGFRHMEVIATSHFKKCVRELREDPWERIRFLAKRITRTPMTLMMGHGITAFDLTPFSVVKLFLERIAAAGIQRVEVMDAANDMSFRIPECVGFAREVGLEVSLPLIYSHSPKHTDDYYAERTADAARLKPDTIYLKDSGGLLTPERTRTVIPAMLRQAGDIPLELHSHCTTGLAPLCYLEAVDAGIRTLHTALPPLANGASQPSLFNVVSNLRLRGYECSVNLEDLRPVTRHFEEAARREGLPLGAPLEYDEYQYVHQVPGGVISNLKHQLAKLRLEDRLADVLTEIVEVKKDLGYPIMVTPFSQFVASQAAINILTGERYKQVTDEVMRYALGFWGKEAAALVDPKIADRVLSSPRGRELRSWEPPQPSIEELRGKLGGPSLSDDDLILRFMGSEPSELQAIREAGPAEEYVTGQSTLGNFIHELLRQPDLSYLQLEKGDLRLSLRRDA